MRYSCAYSVVIFLELAGLLRHASLESVPYRERCPRPHLKNGWVKIRSRGRIAKFNCVREFQLLGEKFATCLDGEWDNPPPLCVRPGCEPLSLSNGQMMATYRGAVVTFFCNPGYRLQGIAKLYCDGKTWNGTAPQCTAMSKEPAVWCDFESADLCGWTQDPHHHFNWTRLSHNTPSGSVGTGPSFDHTLGKGKDGYYLYIETSGPRKQNDTARLYSPVYGTEVVAAQPSCFIFWYHMYGATVGSLAVYIKPDNVELTDDLEAGFFQSGNKGDVWLNGVVNIRPIGVPFQIIIEGVRGPGYVGDTAIDDVRLANGSDCEQPTTELTLATTHATPELSTEDDGQSCRLRCNVGEETNASNCDCHYSCTLFNTCCEDYSFYCINSSVTTASTRPSRTFPTPPPLPPLEPHPLESSTTIPIFRPIPIPPDPTPLILNVPTRATPATSASTAVQRPITAATTSTPLRNLTVAAAAASSPTTKTATTTTTIPTTKTATTTSPTTKTATTTTTRSPTSKTATTTSPTTKTATTTTTTSPTTKTATTTTSPATKTATTTTSPRKTATTTRTIPTTKTATTTTTTSPTMKTTTITTTKTATTSTTRPATKTTVKKPIVVPTTAATKTTVKRPITTTTTTSTTPKPRPTFKTTKVSTSKPRITTTTITKSSTWRPNTMRSFLDNDIQGKEWNIVPREPLMQSEQSVPIALIAGITVLVATVAVVSIVVSIFIRQRRKSRSQQNLADDSDVRFLTAEEFLDFALARPTEQEDENSN